MPLILPSNNLQTTPADAYSDSDDSYDILIDNLNNNHESVCQCIICSDRRKARKERQRKKKEEKRRRKAKEKGKKIIINGLSASWTVYLHFEKIVRFILILFGLKALHIVKHTAVCL